MAISIGYGRHRPLELSVGELAGALGDSVTVLPIVIAVGTLSDYSLPGLLLGFAVFQVVWGLYYGAPVSVEPMKALAALAIAGALSAGQLAGAGLLAGAVLLVAGRTRTLGRIERAIGEPVVRGVQLAVALVLAETGLRLGAEGVVVAVGAAAVVVVVTVLGYRRASALVVLALGLLAAGLQVGMPAPTVPSLALAVPDPATVFAPSVLGATAGQLAMTVANAAVATSLLLSDLYDRDVTPDSLATSMGAMNLLAVPFGAMPMCHGSGGVAGKHAFGARTAGANVILGVLYAAAALLAVGLLVAFPLPALGVLLLVIAAELGRASLDTSNLPVTLLVGVLGVATSVGLAFVAGLVVHLALERWAEDAGSV
ncbi:MAG TPA: putative sulfate/molybdate transporter [Halobacteriales archaeon]|nr:putative sulfate/molybdate transporter [Halobacteriales archaeon]